jgi:hypothetical protein
MLLKTLRLGKRSRGPVSTQGARQDPQTDQDVLAGPEVAAVEKISTAADYR